MIPYDELPEDFDHEHLPLSDAQIDEIAVRVAVILKRDLFADIGKTVVEKTLYVIGVGALALAAWLAGRGFLK